MDGCTRALGLGRVGRLNGRVGPSNRASGLRIEAAPRRCGKCTKGYYMLMHKCQPCGNAPATWALSLGFFTLLVMGEHPL